MASLTRRPPAEELANTATHGLGAILSVLGLAWLISAAGRRGDIIDGIGALVFGITLVLLYTASTLYHNSRGWGRQRKQRRLLRLFLRCDYAGIFLLIAGTYTAVVLRNLRDAWGFGLLALVWAVCLAGVVLVVKFRFPGHYRLASTMLYVALGWLLVVAVKPLVGSMPGFSLQLLLAGGLCYTTGVIFFLWKKLPFHHAIWHLFVLAGSACHWVAVWDSLQNS
jgi:hemolysin III